MLRYFPLIQFLFTAGTALLYSSAVSGQLTPRSAESHQQGFFNGQSVHYRAIVREYFFPENGKSPAVSAMSTSYIKENTSEKERPVLFVFNGGPGASSSPLHMSAFGPKRIVSGKDSSTLVENAYCLLDQTDLVFIDPPGTGFTRVFDSAGAATYWDVKGDAQLFLEIIKKWKRGNKREQSPVFLCGESYGTARAAYMIGLAKDIPITGVIFLASVFDLSIVTAAPGNDMPHLLFLPSMAAVAWYHKKLDPRFKTAEQAYEEANRFALDEYLTALAKGIHLPEKDKERIAAKLSELTGLPKQTWLEKNLRVTPKDFQLTLLAKENKRVGQLNGQITGHLHNPGAKPPFDDPSMSFRPSTRGLTGNYFKQTLFVPDTGSYRTLNLGVNSKWNWSSMQEELGYYTTAPQILQGIKEHPKMRFLVAGGYYDLATPLYAGRYVLEHIGVPVEKITYANFPTGHSIFEDERELRKLVEIIRTFIITGKKN